MRTPEQYTRGAAPAGSAGQAPAQRLVREHDEAQRGPRRADAKEVALARGVETLDVGEHDGVRLEALEAVHAGVTRLVGL
jgi:hypothetical protein